MTREVKQSVKGEYWCCAVFFYSKKAAHCYKQASSRGVVEYKKIFCNKWGQKLGSIRFLHPHCPWCLAGRQAEDS